MTNWGGRSPVVKRRIHGRSRSSAEADGSPVVDVGSAAHTDPARSLVSGSWSGSERNEPTRPTTRTATATPTSAARQARSRTPGNFKAIGPLGRGSAVVSPPKDGHLGAGNGAAGDAGFDEPGDGLVEAAAGWDIGAPVETRPGAGHPSRGRLHPGVEPRPSRVDRDRRPAPSLLR